MEGKTWADSDKPRVQLESVYLSCIISPSFLCVMVYFPRFYFIDSPLASKHIRLSGRGWPLSFSAFLLDGPCKDGAVSHLQTLLSPERQHQLSARDWNNDFCCHTCAFLWSILWTVCRPLIKFMLLLWEELKGRTQMVVHIIELIQYRDLKKGHLDPVIWVKWLFSKSISSY